MFHPLTADGYKLELLHVINPFIDRSKLKKYPVLLSHGFTLAGYNFVMQSANESKALPWPRKSYDKWNRSSDRNLAILLANNGYDVWLSTSRASLSSTKPDIKLHTKFSVHDPKFWQFTLDEQARYDIPCEVDTVLQHTRASKLIFGGYSQSTFTMLGQLALNREFAQKIHTFLVIAPITSMQHATGLLRPIGGLIRRIIPESLRDFAFLPVPVGRIITKVVLKLYSVAQKPTLAIFVFIFNLTFGNNGNKGYDVCIK